MEFFQKILALPETAALFTLVYKMLLAIIVIVVLVWYKLRLRYWIGIFVGILFIPIDYCLNKMTKFIIKNATYPRKTDRHTSR
jgi:hypothetical protein